VLAGQRFVALGKRWLYNGSVNGGSNPWRRKRRGAKVAQVLELDELLQKSWWKFTPWYT